MTATAHTTRRVALLDPSVAERIAAGEVIERPASVVKELVENALDAGSSRILVDVKDGGQRAVQVADDGCGMSKHDAALSLNRFATSKIRNWDDVESLHTLGFRGEALPSIVAVSRLELLTREAHASMGTRIVARGSDPVRIYDAGGPVGTTATVTDLFFNTPARRKFLKNNVAEAARIVDLLGRLSLLHTNVHFCLTSAEREVFNFPLQYGLAERLRRLWHVGPGDALVEIGRQDGESRLRGVLVRPPAFASTRTRQVIYVNGRLVVNSALSVALAQGFEPLLADRKFPMAVLFIEVPPSHVDVNVHPTKSEVRFLYPRQLFSLVRDAVAEALVTGGATPRDPVDAIARLTHDVQRSLYGRSTSGASETQMTLPCRKECREEPPVTTDDTTQPLQTVHATLADDNTTLGGSPPPSTPQWRVLCQLHRTYIVCLRGDELWLVDQHTAHERVNYELLAHLTDGSRAATSQPLLFPTMLELPPDEATALGANLEVFEDLGYSIEPFGGQTFVVRALPAGLEALTRPAVLRQIVAEVTSEDGAQEPRRLRELLRATTACRASVMAGDTLTTEEMQTLLSRLEAVPRGGYCPHGRPVSIRLSENDLARLFGRR